MQNTDIKTVELIINSQSAKQKLDELHQKIEKVNDEKNRLARTYGTNDPQYKKLRNQWMDLQVQAAKLKAKGESAVNALNNLDKATPKQLRAAIARINGELNSGAIERGSNEWKKLTEAMRQSKLELSKIRQESSAVHQSFTDKISSWGNKWMGLTMNIQAAVAALTGLRTTIINSIQAYANMEESMAQVRKYTGWTADEVEHFNEALKQMDTRTGRDKLNSLAGDAGKLGITSQKAVKEFVDAADKINVALGDDLGDDAVKNVGKLAMMFGEDKKLGLRGAMLATGSVINELSQNSSAGAGYLEDFTARVSGVGKQANMTQAQIMGFASVLDANMQQDETAATTFSQLITKMFQDPAKFAKLAGKDVKEFTTTLKTDANQAIIQFLQAMNAKGGFADLAPMFEGMGLNGSRATGVLSALASKLGDVNKMQTLANKSYKEATSITNEFNVQNNTVQAHLDKAKKQFLDLSIDLGKKLLPLMTYAISGTSMLVKSLSALISFVFKYKTQISVLTSVIVAYTIVLNTHYLLRKGLFVLAKAHLALMTLENAITKAATAIYASFAIVINTVRGNTLKAAEAQKLFNTVTKANPWALIISILATAGIALYAYLNRTKDLTAAEKEQIEIRKKINQVEAEAAQETAKTKVRLQSLWSIINDNNQALKQRKAALEELKKMVPDYHGTLTKEGTLINDNTYAIAQYIKNLDKMALAQALFKKIEANAEKQITEKEAVQSWEAAVKFRENKMNQSGHESNIKYKYLPTGFGAGQMIPYESNELLIQDKELLAIDSKKLELHQKNINSIKAEGKAYQDLAKQEKVSGMVSNLMASGGTSIESPTGNTTNVGTTLTEEQLKKIEAARKKREAAAKKAAEERLKRLRQEAKDIQHVLEEDKAKTLSDFAAGVIDVQQYRDKINTLELSAAINQRTLFNKDEEDYKKYNDDVLQLQQKQAEDRAAWSIKDLERQQQDETQANEERYYTGEQSEEVYNLERNAITLKYLKKKADLYRQYGDADQYEETNAAYHQESEKQKLEQQKTIFEKAADLRKEYAQKSIDEQEQDEIKLLDDLIQKGGIKEEERQKFLKEIRDKYQKQRDEGKDKKENLLGSETEPISNSFIELAKRIQDLHQKLKDGKVTWQDYASVAIGSLQMISAIASAAANLYNADQQAQEQEVTDRYDKEIEAAGSSTTKGKQLEEKKQKELANIKNKYNKKAQTMEIAQAVASTAMAAINAYASASKVNWLLGPIAAAMAVAAGTIQIAAIKKQHEAQTGYYSGGFTSGSNYTQEAGVVHQGEFVANHQAVQNRNILPVLRLLDYAQQNNTIGSLTAADVSRTVTAPVQTISATQQAAPALQIVNNMNEHQSKVLEKLNERLEKGTLATVVIDGQEGLARQLKRYNQLQNNR